MRGYEELERIPLVLSSLSEDLYLSFEWMSEDVAIVHAKVVPMMSSLWAGMVLLAVGLVMRLFSFEMPLAKDAA